MTCPRQFDRLAARYAEAATARVFPVHSAAELWDSPKDLVALPLPQHRRIEVCWPPGRRRCYCVSITCVCKVFARAAARAVDCSEGETGWRLGHDEPCEIMALRVGKGPGSRGPDSCDAWV